MTLKQARERKGWSQQRLEEETRTLGRKVDQRNISKIESGGIEDVMNTTAETLEKALGIPRGTLVFGRSPERMSA